MSVTVDECALIYKAVVRNNVLLAVGHVLRYTRYTKAVKRVLDSKVLGDIVNIQHLEPVGFWHFAHSVSMKFYDFSEFFTETNCFCSLFVAIGTMNRNLHSHC